MGRVLAQHPLINYKRLPVTNTPPVPFPTVHDQRPLAGIRIVELARIIALPATGAVLTSLGAEVVRVQNKDLPDFTVSPSRPVRLDMCGALTLVASATQPDSRQEDHSP